MKLIYFNFQICFILFHYINKINMKIYMVSPKRVFSNLRTNANSYSGQEMTIGGSLNLGWMTREGHSIAGHVCKMDHHL